MNVTVIGAGNGGKAVAADMTLAGHEVTLFNGVVDNSQQNRFAENPFEQT